jgi:hypothetical protein
MALILYDLAGAEAARRFSPYCWRSRLAIAHKELPVETMPWRFTDKEVIAFSGRAESRCWSTRRKQCRVRGLSRTTWNSNIRTALRCSSDGLERR